ncbi:hypothetical protein A8924_5858 [Saccharopolyspora erythraea NRRL 2338]|uniref:Uncharacterized protein n=2 Tax=Saccharopolyspora erythraea TaxID=1836 RepID=A4FKY2_SACEN|nr:hypothetical protein [Saccharopolyspora erythraea]EQD82531.1 hypothetical protein N599_30155 [Saccharopolyspora erythraea D]PFG98347.1 hypothetical protein A8924_5858 [Saccharopolyspora erythraea NRRL 2338]QRK88421.1 hypothetical protein JQX30_27680 [Saccharopolyspora erythraea]CAM04707.1 hypothetical protein SACE_5515 [Saccharopolyspora erythraea NRRL 2338]
MTAPGTYGLKVAQMDEIIRRTEEKLQEMKVLNTMVTSDAGAIMTANQSDSGKLLMDKFNVWTNDFNQIRSKLVELNDKVKALRQLQLANTHDATSVSGADI